MHERLRHGDEPFDTQINFRIRESVARCIPELAKIHGETRQEYFDRLVGEDYERYLRENADALIEENKRRIAEIEAEIEEILAVTSSEEDS